jgi:hypothetical protein
VGQKGPRLAAPRIYESPNRKGSLAFLQSNPWCPRITRMLPSIPQLINRCRALAALDLILSPNWEGRYYSFDSHWSKNELMASMRDGCGDEWWILFDQSGWAAIKGLAHESSAWSRYGEKLSWAIQRLIPGELKRFSTEPAFGWEATSFAYIQTAGADTWLRVNDLTDYAEEEAGELELLRHLIGGPSDYADFARDYYEVELDAQPVASIFAICPITEELVKSVNPNVSLSDIADELHSQIQYPVVESE